MRHFDILIIGAGPAGAFLGYHLARRGVSTAIIEKKRLPRYKPCGGGLTARAVALLPFSIQSVTADTAFRPVLRVGGRTVYDRKSDRPVVTMVMRSEFDALLSERAAEAGTAVISGAAFKGVSGPAGRLRVETSGGTFSAGYLVAADGAGSRAGRALGLSAGGGALMALEAEIAPPRWSMMARFQGTAHFDFGTVPGGYGWVFPKAAHLSAGVLAPPAHGRRLRKFLSDYLAEKGLGAGRVIHMRGHAIPCGANLSDPLASDRGMLVGDAAGLADPITGEGIFQALKSAELAADAIVEGMKNGGRPLWPRYVRGVREALVSESVHARRIGALIYRFPKVGNRILQRFGEPSAENLMAIITGRKTYAALRRELFAPRRLAAILISATAAPYLRSFLNSRSNASQDFLK